MKYIITILLLSIGLYSYSQDSTQLTYVNLRGNFFIKATDVPAWKIDGYNAVIYAGDTLVRVRESGIFTAEELKIYPNGSSMSSQINTVFGLPFVKEVKFSSDSTRIFYANDSIDLQNKIATFENGAQIRALSGNLKVKNLTINAPYTTQIFDTSVSVVNVQSANQYISVGWWGPDTTYTNDTKVALQKPLSIAQSATIYFPPGQYKTTGTVYANYNLKIVMDGTIRPTHYNAPSLVVGEPGKQLTSKQYILRVARTTDGNEWADSNNVGIRMYNLDRSEVTVMSLNGFYTGFEARAEGGTFVGSTVDIPYAMGNKTHVYLKNVGSGYITGNKFKGGYWTWASSFHVGEMRYTAIIGDPSQSDRCMNNTFEVKITESSVNTWLPYWIRFGSETQIADGYIECSQVLTHVVGIGPNSLNTGNNGTFGYVKNNVVSLLRDSSLFTNNYFNQASQLRNDLANYIPIVSIPNLADYTTPVSTTEISFSGGLTNSIATTGLPHYSNAGSVEGQWVTMPTTSFGAIMLPLIQTTVQKEFHIRRAIRATGEGGRIYIRLMNAKYQTLGSDVPINSSLATSTSTNFGNTRYSGTEGDFNFILPDTVKYIRIYLSARGGNPLALKSIYVYARAQRGPNIISNATLQRTAPAAPTVGTFKQGDVIFNSNPADTTQPIGWVATTSGTARSSFPSISYTSANNSNRVYINSNIDSINVGDFVLINSVPKQVIGKVPSDTIIIATNATATTTGALTLAPLGWRIIGGGSNPDSSVYATRHYLDSIAAVRDTILLKNAEDNALGRILFIDGDTVKAKVLKVGVGITFDTSATAITINSATYGGTYTATIGSTSNLDSNTPSGFTYIRSGNIVQVSGYIGLTFTSTSAATGFTISLPFPSDIGSASDLKGHITGGYAGADGIVGMIRGDATGNVAAVNFTSTTLSSDNATITFQYEIK